MDPKRLGVSGHSAGAVVAQQVGGVTVFRAGGAGGAGGDPLRVADERVAAGTPGTAGAEDGDAADLLGDDGPGRVPGDAEPLRGPSSP
jgi:hypothetical protein